MTKKVITLRDKTIQVYERVGFFGKIRIHEQKTKYDQDCKTVMVLFAKFAAANKLPKNSQEIIEAIAQSYKNCERTFTTRKPFAAVVDVDIILDELVGVKK